MEDNRVSYIKKRLARRSKYSAFLVVMAIILLCVCFHMVVENDGIAELNAAAVGFCSLLIGIVGMIYGAIAFFERDKNYILARISIIVGGILVFSWLAMIVIGLI